MRNALPNAAFIGFTGTPLMAGEGLNSPPFQQGEGLNTNFNSLNSPPSLAGKGAGGLGLSEFEIKKLQKQIRYMESTDMAVIISQSQGETAAFANKGLDITPHRKRIVNEAPALDEKFKDAENPLRIVFVCAMWITGFDAPN